MREKNRTNLFVKLALAFFAIFCAVMIVTLQFKMNALKSDLESLQRQVDAKNEVIGALKNQLDTPMDEDYIIRVAREKLNMRLPEEILYYNDLQN